MGNRVTLIAGEDNVIEAVTVNGQPQPVEDKVVDIKVPSYTAGEGIDITDGKISINVPLADDSEF